MNNPEKTVPAASGLTGPWGFVLLLVVCLPLLLWRMSLESSVWYDETLSVLMSQHDWRHIIDITANAAHPAGYYLLLKLWIWLGRHVGLAPGVFWGRLLNVIPWLALAAVAWHAGRRLLGPSRGALLTWCLMLGAQETYVAKDMRGYALAVPALGIAFLLLCLIEARRWKPDGSGWPAGWLWAGYGLALAVALWMHILSSLLDGLLGLTWLALARRGPGRRGFLVGGALAHAAALLCFSPWFALILHNVRFWNSTPHDYMTPPTLANLARVFVLWYPLGQLSGGAVRFAQPDRLIPLGVLATFVPLAALAWAHIQLPRRPETGALGVSGAFCAPRAMMGLALGLAAGYVLLLWGLDRAHVIQVFFGPRYTVMGVTLWAAGLVLAATRATDRAGWPPWIAWALMAAWMLCGLTGQAIDATLEQGVGLPAALRAVSSQLPPAGSPIYVMPSELIPFYRHTLAAYDVRRIEALANGVPDGAAATVLKLSFWEQVETERDALITHLIHAGQLADRATHTTYPSNNNPTKSEISRLEGFHAKVAADAAAAGWKTNDPPPPPGAVANVHPRDFWMTDGWHSLEVDGPAAAIRWTAGAAAGIRVPVALAPGRYVLGLEGSRLPYPSPASALTITVDGETTSTTIHPPVGWMNLKIPFVLEHAHERPIVRLRYPVFRVMDYLKDSQDPRWVGLLIHRIWIAPADR